MESKDIEPKEKPSFADEIIMERQKLIKQKEAEKGLGIGEQTGESLQASIVKGAMSQQAMIMDELHKQTAEANKELLEARKEREQAQTQLYNERISILQGEKQKLDAAAQQAKGVGAAPSELDAYKKVREALKEEIDELKKGAPPPSGPPLGLSAETHIKLQEMSQNHELEMKRLDIELSRQDREFNIKLAEWQEESRRRWREYEDKVGMQQKGFDGFSDLAGAISSGIGKERETISRGGEESIQALASQFPCQFCKTKVLIQPGELTATCPNEECGAIYNVKSK